LQDRAPKDIYLYPLRRDARQYLCEAVAPAFSASDRQQG